MIPLREAEAIYRSFDFGIPVFRATEWQREEENWTRTVYLLNAAFHGRVKFTVDDCGTPSTEFLDPVPQRTH